VSEFQKVVGLNSFRDCSFFAVVTVHSGWEEELKKNLWRGHSRTLIDEPSSKTGK
jgi:hypothetical protein